MKVITWNMQGASDSDSSKWRNAAKDFFVTEKADVVCLQESGWPLASQNFAVVYAKEIEQTSRPIRFLNSPSDALYASFIWHPFSKRADIPIYVFWLQTDAGGNRVNLSILSLEKPSYYMYIEPVTVKPNFSTRPAIGVGIGVINIFCIHANSKTHGADAPQLIDTINTRYRSWYAAGDFNREPSPPWNDDNGTIWPPDRATHNKGGKLDYMVAFAGKKNTGTTIPMQVSDHDAVAFTF